MYRSVSTVARLCCAANLAQEKMRYFCDRLEAEAPSHLSACLRIQLGHFDLAPAPLREGFPNELV
jgi:hypothetical protein